MNRKNVIPMTVTEVGIVAFLILAIGSVDTKDDYTQVKKNTGSSSSSQSQPAKTITAFPQNIRLGKVKMVADGFKAECAFMKGEDYCLVRGKLTVEVYNWNMQDNVKYDDPDTYGLGTLLIKQTFDISPADFDTARTPPKVAVIVNTGSRPNPSKTYIIARFVLTSPDNRETVVGGSDFDVITSNSPY